MNSIVKIGLSLSVFPTSWEIGKATIRNKAVWALGPFRFSIHRVVGSLSDYARS